MDYLKTLLRPILNELEREGRAKVFGQNTAHSSTEIGVKFV